MTFRSLALNASSLPSVPIRTLTAASLITTPDQALPRRASPARLVPTKFPAMTVLAAPAILIPSVAPPETTFLSKASEIPSPLVPIRVSFTPLATNIPAQPLGLATEPLALVPTRLPAIVVLLVFGPSRTIPNWPLAETTFPSRLSETPLPSVPMRVFKEPISARIPSWLFPRPADPNALVPIKLPAMKVLDAFEVTRMPC